jgi:heme-degrading monooxygenase HmoA
MGSHSAVRHRLPAANSRKELLMRAIKTDLSRRTFVAGSLGGIVALSTMVSAKSQNAAMKKEPTNRVQTNTVILVNVFTVEPENQQKLVDLLKGGTGEFFSKAPGFISSRILSGKNGTRVINYSQWKSAEEIAAFRQEPYFGPYVQRLKALSSAESIECEMVYDKHV